MRPIILINDPTASGGTVIQGSGTTIVDGATEDRVAVNF